MLTEFELHEKIKAYLQTELANGLLPIPSLLHCKVNCKFFCIDKKETASCMTELGYKLERCRVKNAITGTISVTPVWINIKAPNKTIITNYGESYYTKQMVTDAMIASFFELLVNAIHNKTTTLFETKAKQVWLEKTSSENIFKLSVSNNGFTPLLNAILPDLTIAQFKALRTVLKSAAQLAVKRSYKYYSKHSIGVNTRYIYIFEITL